MPPDPYRPIDAEARTVAAQLLRRPHCALATLRDGAPLVTRAACLHVPGSGMTLLLSDLSDHAKGLAADARCSVLLGEAGAKGDPLTHPRLTLSGRAVRADKDALRPAWRAGRPKTRLYYDFADFRIWRLDVDEALLNAGFGKAYRFGPGDLP